MNNLYGSIQNGIANSTRILQQNMDALYKAADDMNNTDDPQEAKRLEIEAKNITNNLTYYKGVEDLLVQMATLPT